MTDIIPYGWTIELYWITHIKRDIEVDRKCSGGHLKDFPKNQKQCITWVGNVKDTMDDHSIVHGMAINPWVEYLGMPQV